MDNEDGVEGDGVRVEGDGVRVEGDGIGVGVEGDGVRVEGDGVRVEGAGVGVGVEGDVGGNGRFHYTFDVLGRGFMNEAPIRCVALGEGEVREGHLRRLRTSHVNELKAYTVDEREGKVIYESYDYSLVNYIHQQSFPLEPYTIPHSDPAQKGDLLTQPYKDLIKSAIKYLIDQYRSGRTLMPFGAGDLCMKNGVLKFGSNIRTTENIGPAYLTYSFNCLATIIRNTILGRIPPGGGLPLDIGQLIRLLSGIIPWPHEADNIKSRMYLLENHFSLMNGVQMDQFATKIQNCQGWIHKIPPYWAKYESAVLGTQGIYRGWGFNIHDKSPLMKIWDFRYYAHYSVESLKYEWIDFVRNAVQHLSNHKSSSFGEGDCSKMLVITFPGFFSSLQLYLANNSVLERVMGHPRE